MEYGNSAWCPYKQKHINSLERVQRRATKLIPELRNLPYEERLKKLKLPTLVYRRLRGDMIELFKMVHGIYDSQVIRFLTYSNIDHTRGHPWKLFLRHARVNVRKNFFGIRTVVPWNDLPETIVSAPSVKVFEG